MAQQNTTTGPATAGERWTTDALTALRDARFSPAATAAFLRASFERANTTRLERPALARQSHRWIVAGTVGTFAVREAAARLNKPVPRRGVVSGWLALEALMLDWHLGMLEGPSGEVRDALSSADALTLARAALAPLTATAPPDRAWFMLLLGVAGTTDLLDGQLARRAGTTRFGRDFDSLADLAFRAAAIHGARREGWIDQTSQRLLTARQAVFAGRAAWHWFAHSHRPPPEPYPLTRWHVPLLFSGLVTGALGQPRASRYLLRMSVVLGSVRLLESDRTRTPL